MSHLWDCEWTGPTQKWPKHKDGHLVRARDSKGVYRTKWVVGPSPQDASSEIERLD